MKPINTCLYQPNQENFVIRELDFHDGKRRLWFFCEGCGYAHFFDERWNWNEDYIKPTFEPSLLVCQSEPLWRCHSFVRDGMIQYLGDCFHKYKNQTIPLRPSTDDFLNQHENPEDK